WAAKYGEVGVADQALYDDEYDIVASNRYGEAIRPAFEAAGIEYGRADFALVDGRPQVYEINSNPMLERIAEHPFPVRLRTDAVSFERLGEALAAIGTASAGASGPAVRLADAILVRQRRFDRLMTRSRWTP